jgi:peptide/nickel transport system substrate-binding protein
LSGDAQYVNIMPLSSLDSLTGADATLITITKGNDLGAFIDTVEKGGAPKTGPTGNLMVRQALQYSINKQELVQSVLKNKTVNDNGQLIGAGLPGYTTSVTEYAYNPQKAAQLLDAAGYKVGSSGSRFTMTMASAFAGPGSVRLLIGEYMQAAFTKMNIDVQFTALTDTTLELDYFYDTKQRPDILHFGLFTRPYMDAAKAYSYFTSNSGAYHFADPTFDSLYNKQLEEADVAKRQALLAQMTEIMHTQSPYIFTTGDVWIDAASKNLKGVVQCDAETEQYLDTLYMVD